MFPFTRRRKTKTNILATECAFYSAGSIPRSLHFWFTHVSLSVFTGDMWGSPEGPVALAASRQGLQMYSGDGARVTDGAGGVGTTERGGVDSTVRRRGYLHFCFAHAVPQPGMPFYFSVRATPTHPSKPSPSLPRVLQAEWALTPRGSLSPAPIPHGTGHLVCPSLDRGLLESGTMTTHFRKPSPGQEVCDEVLTQQERKPGVLENAGPCGRLATRGPSGWWSSRLS